MSAIAMASGAPRLEYSPKVASSSVSSAAMTVAAEKVIDSPTRATACVTASWGAWPARSSSLTRKTRNAHQIDDRVAQFYLLDAFGCHAALSGQARRAAQLLGAADTARAEAGATSCHSLLHQ
jgi:hypothetical protein